MGQHGALVALRRFRRETGTVRSFYESLPLRVNHAFISSEEISPPIRAPPRDGACAVEEKSHAAADAAAAAAADARAATPWI
eukprot:2540631-Pleurochrysis_carterae.AAC.1